MGLVPSIDAVFMLMGGLIHGQKTKEVTGNECSTGHCISLGSAWTSIHTGGSCVSPAPGVKQSLDFHRSGVLDRRRSSRRIRKESTQERREVADSSGQSQSAYLALPCYIRAISADAPESTLSSTGYQ